ncbi:MAG: ketoacyl-ACP synthase III [Gemmatimonadaceae bacterium]
MRASIRAIEYYFPQERLSNETLAAEYPDWTAEKIHEKIGIDERHIAAPGENSSDLAAAAILKLFESGAIAPADVDYLILCTQSPDYFLPTTACLVQNKVGLPKTCGALDINLGCSGYIYGLGLAKGLIESGQAHNVVLVTAETYSKFIHPKDKSVRTLFGDAAAATLISDAPGVGALVGPFAYGTDGSGAENLIVPTGGMRRAFEPNAELQSDDSGNQRTINNLYMNGAEIFAFTLRAVPEVVNRVLAPGGLTTNDVDIFVMHQANAYMLAHLQRKLRLPADKFVIDMADCGNTVSSTIPIALRRTMDRGVIKPGMRVMLVGFGVGYSWGATLVDWTQ